LAEDLRLVIGENNEDLATTLSLLLGAEPDMQCVATAASAAAVRAALESTQPNAFLLDLSLDDGSSLPLITSLRQQLPTAVIIVHTGYHQDGVERQCLQAGADRVVVKTGDIDELIAALREAARQRQSAIP
jgi:DNA-binding NarL/FixJ family response regulator